MLYPGLNQGWQLAAVVPFDFPGCLEQTLLEAHRQNQTGHGLQGLVE